MGIESVNGVWDLVETWPLGADSRTTSDDHHRAKKSALLKTFPSVAGTINATHSEINFLSGIDGKVQDQFDAISVSAALLSISAAELGSKIDNISSCLNTVESATDALSKQYSNRYHATVVVGHTGDQWVSGWIVNKISSGQYQVFHSFGSADYVVSLTQFHGHLAVGECFLSFKGPNAITIVATDEAESLRDVTVFVTIYRDT